MEQVQLKCAWKVFSWDTVQMWWEHFSSTLSACTNSPGPLLSIEYHLTCYRKSTLQSWWCSQVVSSPWKGVVLGLRVWGTFMYISFCFIGGVLFKNLNFLWLLLSHLDLRRAYEDRIVGLIKGMHLVECFFFFLLQKLKWLSSSQAELRASSVQCTASKLLFQFWVYRGLRFTLIVRN